MIEKLFFERVHYKKEIHYSTSHSGSATIISAAPSAPLVPSDTLILLFWGSSVGTSFLRSSYNAGCKV